MALGFVLGKDVRLVLERGKTAKDLLVCCRGQ
jgi:hypothetical protein